MAGDWATRSPRTKPVNDCCGYGMNGERRRLEIQGEHYKHGDISQ
jgi:hypothetical protein